jgi:hypothetical protein
LNLTCSAVSRNSRILLSHWRICSSILLIVAFLQKLHGTIPRLVDGVKKKILPAVHFVVWKQGKTRTVP